MNSNLNQTSFSKILDLGKEKTNKVNSGKQVVISKKPENDLIKTLSNLGDMIKYKRTKSKLSIKKTASLCGISDKTLRSIENGDNTNTATLLIVINMLGLKLRLEE